MKLRFALVGVILGVAGAFAYLGGWLTPRALTPARFVAAFERANGSRLPATPRRRATRTISAC